MIVNWCTVLQGVLLFCISYAVIKVCELYWSKRRFFSLGNKFNGPPTAPLFGSALSMATFPDYLKIKFHFSGLKFLQILRDILALSVSNERIYEKVKHLTNKYGRKTIRVYVGWSLHLYIVDANDAQIVLNNALTKADLYHVVEPLIGKGIFGAPVPAWKRHRKLLNAAFNVKILETYVNIFNEESKVLARELEDFLNGQEFDAGHFTNIYNLKIFWRSILGYKLKPNVANKAYESLQVRPALEKEHWGDFGEEETCLDNQGQKSFMNILFAGKSKWTDKEITDEMATFMYGGTDTGAHNLAYVFMMLGLHSDIQNKCYQELYQIFEDSDRDVELEDFKKMTYLEQCIKETLRILPAVPFVGRKVLEDLKISDGIIPAGANVIIGIPEMHRDPDVFPNPGIFDPDRFLPENIKKRAQNTYIPFSSGPRNCIGQTHARFSSLILMSHILRKYEIICNVKIEDIRVTYAGVSRPIGGFAVRLKAREARDEIPRT